jgi:hypothetical protein
MTDPHNDPWGWPDPNFNANQQKVPLEVWERYAGQYVAWSWDGTQVLAAAADREQLDKELLAKGIDPQRVVHGFVDEPTISHL